ncbi:MAG: pyruvate dehydrogenase E1 component subunit alpha [Parcubacteria group bacterium Gr01-1014_91]|nr:MAG: pyruvate dehydrogenase E1 component subunit alpha [Parcubacteria group bacterium Gr01-1014_91]
MSKHGKKIWTPQELIAFEEQVAELFNTAKIKAPVHLYYGNEKEIIEVFRDVKEDDWVMCSWRSHYQCLLKGVPPEKLKEEIVAGRSISLCFPEQKIVSSAIVGGIVPIAVGVAMGIKRNGGKNRVHCFIGDMTSETGIAHECIKYSVNHELPIRFIIEDNEKSVCTDTRETWKQDKLTYEDGKHPSVVYYKYQTKYPHAGAGVRVQF